MTQERKVLVTEFRISVISDPRRPLGDQRFDIQGIQKIRTETVQPEFYKDPERVSEIRLSSPVEFRMTGVKLGLLQPLVTVISQSEFSTELLDLGKFSTSLEDEFLPGPDE